MVSKPKVAGSNPASATGLKYQIRGSFREIGKDLFLCQKAVLLPCSLTRPATDRQQAVWSGRNRLAARCLGSGRGLCPTRSRDGYVRVASPSVCAAVRRASVCPAASWSSGPCSTHARGRHNAPIASVMVRATGPVRPIGVRLIRRGCGREGRLSLGRRLRHEGDPAGDRLASFVDVWQEFSTVVAHAGSDDYSTGFHMIGLDRASYTCGSIAFRGLGFGL